MMPSFVQLKTLDKVSPWLLFVLIVWLCWKLAALFWLVLAPPQAPIARAAVMPSGQQHNVPNVTSFSLFQESAADASASSTPLKLEGIFMGWPSSQSAAVIRVADKSSRYQVGQQIEGTPQSLSAVSWDHVIVRTQDGRETKLSFTTQPLNNVANNQQLPANAVVPNVPPPATPQSQLGSAVQQLQSNPSGYLNQMGVSSTGQGYEITAATPPDMRNKLGLRPGDKIVSLNGRPLGQVQSDVKLLEQLQQQHNAQIEIRRGDQTMTIQQSF